MVRMIAQLLGTAEICGRAQRLLRSFLMPARTLA
jgi:hypothetical protein